MTHFVVQFSSISGLWSYATVGSLEQERFQWDWDIPACLRPMQYTSCPLMTHVDDRVFVNHKVDHPLVTAIKQRTSNWSKLQHEWAEQSESTMSAQLARPMCAVTRSTSNITYRVAQKRGHHLIVNILKFHDRIAWKLVNFCNIICWTQSLTFCLKISSRCGAT